jgi:hypothetical protein
MKFCLTFCKALEKGTLPSYTILVPPPSLYIHTYMHIYIHACKHTSIRYTYMLYIYIHTFPLKVPALGPLKIGGKMESPASDASEMQAPNSQHPAYDIRHGEDLIKQVSKTPQRSQMRTRLILRLALCTRFVVSWLPQVYDSLRSSSHWNDTLLVRLLLTFFCKSGVFPFLI